MDTPGGDVVIPGDEVYLYANLDEDIPIGYYHDFDRVSRAMDLLREMAATCCRRTTRRSCGGIRSGAVRVAR